MGRQGKYPMIESISFAEFQNGIAPLWQASDPSSIPIYNNPYHIIQYTPDQIPQRMLYRCVQYLHDGEVAGYSSIYNISDTILRIRGIYVLPQFRGKGIGHQMWKQMADLFPQSFYRVVGFWRESSYQRFIEYSNMQIVPNTDWIWSDFSKVRMKFLYYDRGEPADNIGYLRDNLAQYGLGGSCNLKGERDWGQYIQTHAGNYPDLNIDLDFK